MHSLLTMNVIVESETKIKCIHKVGLPRSGKTRIRKLIMVNAQFTDAGLHPVMLENIKLSG